MDRFLNDKDTECADLESPTAEDEPTKTFRNFLEK